MEKSNNVDAMFLGEMFKGRFFSYFSLLQAGESFA